MIKSCLCIRWHKGNGWIKIYWILSISTRAWQQHFSNLNEFNLTLNVKRSDSFRSLVPLRKTNNYSLCTNSKENKVNITLKKKFHFWGCVAHLLMQTFHATPFLMKKPCDGVCPQSKIQHLYGKLLYIDLGVFFIIWLL